MHAPSHGLRLPMQLGRYELLAKIADGGMASVYLGRLSGPMGFQRPVAVKLMLPAYVQSEEFVKMFLDEARLVARLTHPNIVQLLELGQDDSPIGKLHGGFFIVMECLMGESLLDTWYACQDRQLMMPYDLVAWIGARAAEGLHHAHELKDPLTGAFERIVHRDVNPGNIFLTYDGQVKVIDFGVAKALNRLSSATSAGTLKGKVAYMAPEQAKTGDVDRRADVFSLAVTLWELSTDRRLFKRKGDIETLMAVTETRVPDPTTAIPDYPHELWHVLQRALSADREQRHPTALELSRDLDRVAQSLGRAVDAAALAEVMNFLFHEQKNRYVQFLKQASAGESSVVLRASDPKRKDMVAASVDALPMSRRAGGALPIRSNPPAQPAPEPSYDHPTVALPTATFLQQQHAPIPPMRTFPQVAPAPVYAPAAPPPSRRSSASNVVFMLIAGTAVAAVVAYFVYVRFLRAPPPAPPPFLPTTTAPVVTTSAPAATETATATATASVIATASASASASTSEAPSSTPAPSTVRTANPDDILRSRR